jgi:hypothetical protein
MMAQDQGNGSFVVEYLPEALLVRYRLRECDRHLDHE